MRFPLGDFKKSEIRELAKEYKLNAVKILKQYVNNTLRIPRNIDVCIRCTKSKDWMLLFTNPVNFPQIYHAKGNAQNETHGDIDRHLYCHD